MKSSFITLAFILIVLLFQGVVQSLEFDQNARKMGLEGIAWDGTFTVYASDDELAKATLADIQEAYAKILEQLNQRLLRKKCLVFIWRDRYKFILQAKTFAGSSNISHMGAFVIRDRWEDYHALCAYRSDSLYDRVLPHELAHLVLPTFLDPGIKVSIPLWLNEGFAQFQENDSFKGAVCTVNTAMKENNLFRLGALAKLKRYPTSYEKNLLFYDQSEVLVKFLIEKQNEPGKFFKLARALSRSDKSFSSVLASYYPQWENVASLEKDFRSYVNRKARSLQADGYRSAYLKLQSAKKSHYTGNKKHALEEYARALSGFRLISENFPDYKPKAIEKQVNESWNGIAKVADLKDSSGPEIGSSKEEVAAFLGEPENTIPGKLIYPGLELKFSEAGTLSSIKMEAPCKETIHGIRIGDRLGRVELIYGVTSPKNRAALAAILLKNSKLISFRKIKPGSYPVVSKKGFLGQVIKMEDDEDLHFIRPMGDGQALEKITLMDDAVKSLEFVDIWEAGRSSAVAAGSAQAPGEDGKKGAAESPDFKVDDYQSKFVQVLGEPLESGAELITEHKIKVNEKGVRKSKQPSITDRLQLQRMVFSGLYVIMAGNKALCIIASEPFGGTVNGVAIGDATGRVRSLMGMPDYEEDLKDYNLWTYRKMGGRYTYKVYFRDKKVSQVKAYRSKYKNRTLRF